MACGLLVACGGRAPATEPRPAPPGPDATAPDAAPPDAAPLTPEQAFDAAITAAGLTRVTGELRTSNCDGAVVDVVDHGEPLQVRFGGCFRCAVDGDVDPELLAQFTAAIADEPAGFYRLAGVSRVALCTRLVDEVPTDLTEGALLGGTVDSVSGTILLSAEPIGLTGQDIFHHELWHAFDLETDFGLFREDPAWAALNPEPYARTDETRPGFLNPHAHANVREDHATTYQFLMARPDELCAGDAIVIAKARMLRDRVAATLGDARYLDDRAPCVTDAARSSTP